MSEYMDRRINELVAKAIAKIGVTYELSPHAPSAVTIAEAIFDDFDFKGLHRSECVNGRGADFMLNIRAAIEKYSQFVLRNKKSDTIRNTRSITFKTVDVFHSAPRNVTLYGRTNNGERIIVKNNMFYPYTYITVDSLGDDTSLLYVNTCILYAERTALYVGPYLTDVYKVYVKLPWDVKRLRDAYPYLDFYAADIEFALRFFYDNRLGYINTLETSQDGFDIQMRAEDTLCKHDEMIDVELTRLSFDIEQSIKTGEILTICAVMRPMKCPPGKEIQEHNINGVEIKTYMVGEDLQYSITADTSAKLLMAFEHTIAALDPDIITGYYIQGYDFPTLAEVIENRDLKIGFEKRKLRLTKHMRSDGRVIVDTMFLLRKIAKPQRESLEFVSQLLLGEGKDDVVTWKIDEEWARDSKKVVKYCIKDSRLALDVCDKIKAIPKLERLALESKNTLAMAGYDSQARLIDSLIIPEADRRNVAVPMNKFDQIRKDDEEKISGADVSDASSGIFDFVAVFDVKSMYPSMFKKYNIDPTTYIPHGDHIDDDKVNTSEFLTKCDELHNVQHARFLKEPVGMVPTLLTQLWDRRDELKRLMAEAETDEEREHYDFLQGAVKVLMNAMYGVFASSFYRFTNPEIGESITTWAVYHKKLLESILESLGYNVLYGDTDSVFVKLKNEVLEDAIEEGKQLEAILSEEAGILIEFEKILDPMIQMGTKKKYISRSIWPEKKLYIRGIETRRGDSFTHQSDMLEAMIEHLIKKDINEAKHVAQAYIKSVHDVTIEELSITKSVKARGEYKNAEAMQNFIVYMQLKAAHLPAFPGMKVSWINLTGKERVKALELITEDDIKLIDWKYYEARLFTNAMRILQPLGISKIELLYNQKQTGLGEYFSM